MNDTQRGILREALGFRTKHEWQRPGWRNFYLQDTTNGEPSSAVLDLVDKGLMRLVAQFKNGIELYAVTEDGARAVGLSPDNVRCF